MSDDPNETTPGKGNGQAHEEAPAAAEAPEKGVALVEEPAPTRAAFEALEREIADLRDQILRRRADFDNYRKRVERERASAGQDALAALLTDLVPSLDNLERALSAAGDGTALRDGVALIQRGLIATLEAHGLRVDDPHGATFDPQSHQALSYDDAPGHADGSILQVFGKGYFLNDRLLRPALVQVARGARDADAPQAAEEQPPVSAASPAAGAQGDGAGESVRTTTLP